MVYPISIRLSEDLQNALERLAKTTERSKTFLIRKAIERYLAESAEYQIALDRLLDKDDAILTSKELRQQLDL